MPLILFELLKTQKSVQLDIPLDSLFVDVSKLIFKHFNLENLNNSFPSLKFIYNSIICINYRSIGSYGINSQSVVQVFVPKVLIDYFIDPSLINEPQKIFSEAKSKNKTPLHYANEVNPNTPFNILQSSNDNVLRAHYSPPENLDIDNDAIYSTILSLIDQNLLNQATTAGYDLWDASYALIYKSNYNSAVELINLGISSDPSYRYHINEIISGRAQGDDALRHEIEIVKIEARKKNKNENVAVSCLATQASIINRFQSPVYRKELKKFSTEISSRYQEEFYQQFREDMTSGKQFVVFTHGIPVTCNWKATIQRINPEILARIENIERQSVYTTIRSRGTSYNQMNETFNTIFHNLPQMSPDDFTNPFKMLYNDIMKLNEHTDQGYTNILNYAKDLDYKQLMMIYRAVMSGKCSMNEAVQYLMCCGGDVDQTEKILNS